MATLRTQPGLRTLYTSGSHCQRALMRILHVIGSLSPAGGGPPEALRHLVRGWSEIGVNAEVAVQDRADASWLRDAPFAVHALGPGLDRGAFGFSPRLWNWLHGNVSRFDAVVMHGLWSFPGCAVRAACLGSHKPYGIFVHGSLNPWFERRYPLKHLKKRIYWPAQYPVLRDAAAVLFTTEAEARLAQNSFHPNQWHARVIPYAIGGAQGDARHSMDAFYRFLPSLHGRKFFLFLGRIHEVKGCDLLVQAFARVAEEIPGTDLVIAGPDPAGLRAKIEKMAKALGIESRVHWPGMITGELKWGALRGAEALVIASHCENFGVTAVEALACGRPVLLTNQVNICDTLSREQAALVDDDSAAGVERNFRRWLALSAAEHNAMAERAFRCFETHFSIAAAAQGLRRALFEPSIDESAAVTELR